MDLTREQRRSLWLHVVVAGHLIVEPDTVLATARSNLKQWSGLHRRDGPTAEQLRGWASILDQGVPAVLEALIDTSAEGCQRRIASPFPGVLTEVERSAVLALFRQTHPG